MPPHPPPQPVHATARNAWWLNLLLFLLVAAIWAACLHYPQVWSATGIGDTGLPFLDLYGLLASGEFARAHGDAFALNPLDPYHRPHFYTSWWLVTGKVGLTRADAEWVGLMLVGATLLAAAAFRRLRDRRDLARSMLVLCSPAVLMAVNRGNNDLEVFVIIVCALALLRDRRTASHWLGAILVTVAGVLKYYPLAAGIAFLRTRSRREFAVLLALSAVVLALAWPGLKPGLASAVRFKPHPAGLYAFGAPTLFRDFGVESPVGWWLLSLALGVWTAWLLRRPQDDLGEADDDQSATDKTDFICGAALIAGSFFLGASYVYKLIFAVLLLPWLGRQDGPPSRQRWRRAIWWLLLATMWLEGLLALPINLVLTPWSRETAMAALDVTLVLGQLVTWCLVACLVYHVAGYGLQHGQDLLHKGVKRSAAPS